ncbi:hypothetical protein EDB83DRAFT_1949255 [Lactarius deliciosus]|nr:hypothetical protein EDB83DRAFT_1949255 [Lactarius deliciosus]
MLAFAFKNELMSVCVRGDLSRPRPCHFIIPELSYSFTRTLYLLPQDTHPSFYTGTATNETSSVVHLSLGVISSVAHGTVLHCECVSISTATILAPCSATVVSLPLVGDDNVRFGRESEIQAGSYPIDGRPRALCNLILSAMVLRASDTHDLTDVESMLILPAARLCAALKYLADNPGGDHRYYVGKITSELQLASDILGEYASTQETPHRIHPVLTVLGKEWMRVASKGRRPSTLENISLESVEESCADLAKRDPNQPHVFYTTDLSALIDRIPKVQHWWNADAKQDERASLCSL